MKQRSRSWYHISLGFSPLPFVASIALPRYWQASAFWPACRCRRPSVSSSSGCDVRRPLHELLEVLERLRVVLLRAVVRGELAVHGADVFRLGIAGGEESLDRGGERVLVTDALCRLEPPGGDRLLVVERRARAGPRAAAARRAPRPTSSRSPRSARDPRACGTPCCSPPWAPRPLRRLPPPPAPCGTSAFHPGRVSAGTMTIAIAIPRAAATRLSIHVLRAVICLSSPAG